MIERIPNPASLTADRRFAADGTQEDSRAPLRKVVALSGRDIATASFALTGSGRMNGKLNSHWQRRVAEKRRVTARSGNLLQTPRRPSRSQEAGRASSPPAEMLQYQTWGDCVHINFCSAIRLGSLVNADRLRLGGIGGKRSGRFRALSGLSGPSFIRRWPAPTRPKNRSSPANLTAVESRLSTVLLVMH